MVPRRKWARARCMGITPPRCPRARIGFDTFGGSEPLVSWFSKLPEESNASPTSHIGRVVIVVRDDINAPVRTDPLAPSNGQGLTMEVRYGRHRPNQLIRLFSKAGTQRDVVLQIAALRHRDETGRREDRSGIADIETDPFLEDPGLLEVVCGAGKETVIAVDVFGRIVAKTESGNELPARPAPKYTPASPNSR